MILASLTLAVALLRVEIAILAGAARCVGRVPEGALAAEAVRRAVRALLALVGAGLAVAQIGCFEVPGDAAALRGARLSRLSRVAQQAVRRVRGAGQTALAAGLTVSAHEIVVEPIETRNVVKTEEHSE